MSATAIATDTALRDAVARHLEWDPEIDASAIAVTAHGNAVTLTGFINSYAGKLAAERIAKRVRGVRAVANDIQVRLRLARADDDIASEAAHALAVRTELPESVQVVVRHGHVTLTGAVPSLFHRTSAERAVRHIKGIVEVTNRIVVAAPVSPTDVVHRISEALHRIADVNARHINVVINGDTAMLSGHVASWAQRDAAEMAAAGAPGIGRIENRIEVVAGTS
jgi:osmotically-inducible protein OsmY